MSLQQSSSDRGTRLGILRIALSLGAVLFLVHLTRSKDVFADVTRPTVTFALHLLGISAADHGSTISVGRLEVPWTRDCAGMNLLLVLVAITIWVHRSERLGWAFAGRLLSTVPAALLANVARVLCIIAYREVFYPKAESPQLHYFLGLIWLLPFVACFVPKGERPLSEVLIEALHAAAVLALLAPMSGVPGGDAITVAALMGLAQGRAVSRLNPLRSWLTLAWIILAMAISIVGMESFWLPWLLICPCLASKKWLLSPEGALLTLATHPLFGMLPGGVYLTWGAIGWAAWKAFGSTKVAARPLPVVSMPRLRWQIPIWVSASCFVVPFIASAAFSRSHQDLRPPSGVQYEATAGEGFEVSIPGQPDDIGLIWYNPSGGGRHHSMKVCLKYRGVDLNPSADCSDVFTDNQHWMREFYLQSDELLASYPAYIKKTFRPWSSPGVHLIFVTDSRLMSADAFNRICEKLANELHALCLKERLSA